MTCAAMHRVWENNKNRDWNEQAALTVGQLNSLLVRLEDCVPSRCWCGHDISAHDDTGACCADEPCTCAYAELDCGPGCRCRQTA